jgi:hypothetical protein
MTAAHRRLQWKGFLAGIVDVISKFLATQEMRFSAE